MTTRAATPRRTQHLLIVEDDPSLTVLLRSWLGHDSPWRVTTVATGEAAVRLLHQEHFDLVLSDIELPGISGLDVTREAKNAHPDILTALMTAHARLDIMQKVAQANVNALIPKPFSRDELIHSVQELCQASAPAAKSGQVILAIGAHPDDVEIGCGGTLLRHRERGDAIYTLTLTQGEIAGPPSLRRSEAHAAASLLDADLFMGTLADTKVSHGGPTISAIEQVVKEVQPDVVYTHTKHDWHQDHRAVHAASIVACRSVPNVLCYQSPSTAPEFCPNVYVRVEQYLAGKLELLNCFTTQQKAPYLADDMIATTARYWGRFAGYRAAEPFESLRLTSYNMADLPPKQAARSRSGIVPRIELASAAPAPSSVPAVYAKLTQLRMA